MSSRSRSFVVDSNGRSIDFYCTVNGCKVANTNLRIDGLVEQAPLLFPLLALFGYGAMSDLGPLCALERTWMTTFVLWHRVQQFSGTFPQR